MKCFKWLMTAILIATISAVTSAQTDQGKLTGPARECELTRL